MNESVARAPLAHATGVRVTPVSIAEFQELSRRYRDVQAMRNISIATTNLSPIAWAVFADVYHHLWGASEAWPTQALLVQRLGWCERSVRYGLRELEVAELLVVERRARRRPLGGYKLFYLPGRALLEALSRLSQRTLSRRHLLRVCTSLPARLSVCRVGDHAPSDTLEKQASPVRASGTRCQAHPAPVPPIFLHWRSGPFPS